MPDPNNTTLKEFNNWTIRFREAAEKPSRLLLMIHGLTGDENSMWVFARELPHNYWMAAPRAPMTAQPFGYSWYPVPSETVGRPSLENLVSAAEGLIRFVDEIQQSAGIDASDFDVMGFSQGAVMSSALALMYPQRVRKLGIMAGFVPNSLEEYIQKRPLSGKTVFVTHGTKDETVPVERARSSITLLERAGAKVTYCEDEVGHKVSLNCMKALRGYLAD